MIRRIERTDIGELMLLGTLAHAESIWSQYKYTPLKAGLILESCLPMGLSFLDEREEGIVGWCWGRYDENVFSSASQALVVSLYVVPEYRTGMVGLKLLKAFVNEAKSKGTDEILLGSDSMKDTNKRDAVSALFKRVGAQKSADNWRIT